MAESYIRGAGDPRADFPDVTQAQGYISLQADITIEERDIFIYNVKSKQINQEEI